MRGFQTLWRRVAISLPQPLNDGQISYWGRICPALAVLTVALGASLYLTTDVDDRAIAGLVLGLLVTNAVAYFRSCQIHRPTLLLPFLLLLAGAPAVPFDNRVYPYVALAAAALPATLLLVYGPATTRTAFMIGNIGLLAAGMAADAASAVPLWLATVLFQGVSVAATSRLLLRLQETSDRLHDLDGAGNVTWETTGVDGAPLVLNRAAMQFFGLSASVVDRRMIYGLVHSHDLKRVLAHWHEAVQAGGTHLVETRLQLTNGQERVVMHRITVSEALKSAETTVRVLQLDITEQRQTEKELLYNATHDALTGLANTALFADRVAQSLVRAKRERRLLAVLIIDINGFKDINDSLGHAAGDRLLVAIAHRIVAALRDADAVARTAGDQFGVVGEVNDPAGAPRLAERIREMLAAPFEIDELALSVHASIGIALFPEQSSQPDELIHMADLAMRRSKRHGLSYQVYSPELMPSTTDRLTLLGDLQMAMERDELRLSYQPAVTLGDAQVPWVEALVRWRHPHLGTISPAQFFELVEMSVMAGPVARWVVNNAIADAARWAREGVDVAVHVNFPAQLLAREPYDEWITAALAKHGWPANRFGVEIGESELLADRATVKKAFERLRAIGVRTALDDFGTGFSSLGYLADLPVDMLKMDGSYVARLSSSQHLTVVRSIIDLAHDLGIEVVAEGVENQPVLTTLKSIGCDAAQGFFFSKPVSADEIVSTVHHLQGTATPIAAPPA